MSTTPKVSVIIPVYNVEDYLRQCLDSIINQTLKDIEIICVDDGSTDSSLQILHEYKIKDSRVKVMTQKNQHAGVARNAGMQVARGEYFVFLDADDFFEADLLQLQYEKCKKFDADISLCSANCFQQKTGKFERADWLLAKSLIKTQPFNRETLGDKLFSVTGPNPWTKMFSSVFIRKYNLRFQALPRANDVYFTMVALALADKIVAVDRPLVHYRIGMTTNLQANNSLSPLSFCQALSAVKQKLKEENVFGIIEVGFIRNVISQCVYNLKKLDSNEESYNVLINALKQQYLQEFGIDLEHPNPLYQNSFFDELRERVLAKKYEKRIEPSKEISSDENSISISIIIPTYNVELYISECLDSIINQTIKNIEIICVDDGSTDSTINILYEYAEKDHRIKVIPQENQGPSKARNTGLRVATGEFVYFIDSDDYLDNKALNYLYAVSKINHLDAIFFDLISFEETSDGQKIFKPSRINRREYSEIYDGVSFLSTLRKDKAYITSPCLMLLNRSFLSSHDITFFNGILHEDELFCFLILMGAHRVSHVGKKYYYRRIRENSIMTAPKTEKNALGYFVCMREMLKYGLTQEWNYVKSAEIVRSIEGMQRTVKYVYKQLPVDQRKFSISDPISNMLFDNFIASTSDVAIIEEATSSNHASDVLALERKLKAQQITINRLVKEIDNIHISATYKIGRFITWLPRKIRGCIYCYQDHGLSYTLRQVLVHLHLVKRNASNVSKSDSYSTKNKPETPKISFEEQVITKLKNWYFQKCGVPLNLENPLTFNEKMQWIKIYDYNLLKTTLADKYGFRQWVSDNIGSQYLIPLLGVWEKFEDINFDILPNQFVLKATHGSSWNIIVPDKLHFDKKTASQKFNRWLNTNFALQFGQELQYMNIPPQIIAEEYHPCHYEYQFWCFNGTPHFVSVIHSPHGENKKATYDLEWNQLDFVTSLPKLDETVERPRLFEEMVAITKKICADFSFVRVDFMYDGTNIFIGEITFTPASGVCMWEPKKYNQILGDLLKLPPKSPIPERKVF